MFRKWICYMVGMLVTSVLGLAAIAQEADSTVSFSHIAISSELGEDSELAAYLKPFQEGVAAFSAEVIGYAAESLSRTRPECGLSNLVADSLRIVGAVEFEREVDFAITNFGGLRRDLPQGDLTMGLLIELSPFDNYMAFLRIDGILALKIAETVAKSGEYAVSGFKIERDSEGKLLKAWIGGKEIVANRSYGMVTIDYLLATREDLFAKEHLLDKLVSRNLIQRDAIVMHLSSLTQSGVKIKDAAEGRIKTLEGDVERE